MIIRSEKEFIPLLDSIAQADRWAVDTEGVIKIYPDWKLTGTSISLDGKTGFYIPSGHLEGSGQLPAEYVTEKLKPFFHKPGLELFMANSKFDMKVFRLIDPSLEFLEENAFCTMTSSFILDVNNEHGLKPSVFREFGHVMSTLDSIGCPRVKDKAIKEWVYFTDQMKIEGLAPYATDDAVQTFRLGERYKKKIHDDGFDKVYYELEMPLMFILMEMEENGVLLDVEKLKEFLEDAPKKLEALDKEIQEEIPVSRYVNVNSSQQMNELLFKDMGIKPRGEQLKTGGYSVTNANLDLWMADFKVCGMIADYRRLSKLFGNYLTNLHSRLGPDNRIRCNFNRHVADTGRLSSSRPNLQNVPRAENDTYGLRKLFIAPPGRSFICADYSQVELRIEAHLSKDPIMIGAFERDEDIHAATAKEVFKLDCDVNEVAEKYPVKRQIAKSLNFGIIYEAGPKTLAATANKGIKDEKDRVTEEEMEVIMKEYFKRYRGIERYIELCHKKAMKDGYVKTIVGRKRYLPDAQIKPTTSEEHRVRYGAFRKSSNTPTQGSAFDVIAIAKRNIKHKLQEEGLYKTSKFVLQVHDELLVETDDKHAQKVADIVKEKMESAVQLRVPLTAKVEIGKVWGDMK